MGLFVRNMAKLFPCHCNLVLAIRKAQGLKVNQKKVTLSTSYFCVIFPFSRFSIRNHSLLLNVAFQNLVWIYVDLNEPFKSGI